LNPGPLIKSPTESRPPSFKLNNSVLYPIRPRTYQPPLSTALAVNVAVNVGARARVAMYKKWINFLLNSQGANPHNPPLQLNIRDQFCKT
jgi:hypothetical protein